MSRERQDESLFRALIEGDLEESAPEVHGLLTRRPDLAEEWAETRAVFDALRDAAQARVVVIEASQLIDRVPGGARAEARLRELIEEQRGHDTPAEDRGALAAGKDALTAGRDAPAASVPSRPTRTRPRLWPLALAAALLVALFLIARRPQPPEVDRGAGSILLGDGDIELVPLATTDRAHLRFEWKGKLPPGVKLRIYLEGRLVPTEAWTWRYDRAIDGTVWMPEHSRTASWPKHLRWKVRASAGDGTLVGESPWSEVDLLP